MAWTRSGKGPALVKSSNWLTHLDYDRESPVWSHWVQFLETHFSFLRYDERGCGLSDKKVGELTIDHWCADLEAVIAAAAPPEPFFLLGVSQGAATAIAYAARHPEKIAGLILHGGYARGNNQRGDPKAAALYKAVIEVFRNGWDTDNPAFQEIYAARFIPDGTAEQRRWFTDLCERTLSPDSGAQLLMSRVNTNVEALLDKIAVPTLVLHVNRDAVTPLDEGRLLAKRIPGAQFVELDSRNHILQSNEPAWDRFKDSVLEFAFGQRKTSLPDLTNRELDVLRGICRAESNKEIANRLGMSEKTVRNHATNIFSKLGLENRHQAILKLGHLFT